MRPVPLTTAQFFLKKTDGRRIPSRIKNDTGALDVLEHTHTHTYKHHAAGDNKDVTRDKVIMVTSGLTYASNTLELSRSRPSFTGKRGSRNLKMQISHERHIASEVVRVFPYGPSIYIHVSTNTQQCFRVSDCVPFHFIFSSFCKTRPHLHLLYISVNE